MGATITTGKLAAAFKNEKQETVFVLFEETYEKNCTPRIGSWHALFIGAVEGAMEHIFGRASECEGGCLQNRNGYITPEGYIAGWLKELANPVDMPDLEIALSVGDGFYTPIQPGAFDRAKEKINNHGRRDLVEALERGEEVNLSLHDDSGLITDLCADRTVSVWRIIGSHKTPWYAQRNAALGYNPTPAKSFSVLEPRALRADDRNRLLQRPDGSWYCAGWEYSIVAGYIEDLYVQEMKEPGSYRKRIKAIRNSIKASTPVPEGAKVRVDLSREADDSGAHESVNRIAETFPNDTTITGNSYEILPTEKNIYYLCNLNRECATWIIPEAVQAPIQASLF